MKVEHKFAPIVITLETEKEAIEFASIINHANGGSGDLDSKIWQKLPNWLQDKAE